MYYDYIFNIYLVYKFDDWFNVKWVICLILNYVELDNIIN